MDLVPFADNCPADMFSGKQEFILGENMLSSGQNCVFIFFYLTIFNI